MKRLRFVSSGPLYMIYHVIVIQTYKHVIHVYIGFSLWVIVHRRHRNMAPAIGVITGTNRPTDLVT